MRRVPVLAIPAPALSPRVRFELRRKAIHVLVALAAIPLLLYLEYPVAVLLAALVIGVISAVHFVRKWRMPVAPAVALVTDPLGEVLDATRRPHEDYPWAPVTFGIALVSVATVVRFAHLPAAYALAAFGILGVGDAASALIGVAYGKRKLGWNRAKSWEGLAAGLVAGFLAAALFATVDFAFRGAVFPVAWLGIALVGAIAGAFVESLPWLVDNLAVPLGALAAMIGVGALLGLL
ncbi:MAG: hypothetical protein ACYDCK_08575 [Thermoplasmatota archaeon]